LRASAAAVKVLPGIGGFFKRKKLMDASCARAAFDEAKNGREAV
jgi:hypothetical protein